MSNSILEFSWAPLCAKVSKNGRLTYHPKFYYKRTNVEYLVRCMHISNYILKVNIRRQYAPHEIPK